MQGLRVLLLEDDPLDAELITRTLQRADRHCIVRCVSDEPAFLHALESFLPDVVLSDHALAAFRSADALRAVQKKRPESAFLLVSGGFDPTDASCLRTGAVDFIHKSELSRLHGAIVSALQQRAPFLRLSDRQRQVLRLLAGGASTREIAEQLGVSVKTIETHRAQAMKRLGVGGLASLVRFAVKVGIVSPADD